MAVTGTQGKTTTTRLLEGGLDDGRRPRRGDRHGRHPDRPARDVKTALTTPEAPDLHALFAVMVEQGVTACAMEVSSHALVMGRVDGVVFDVAAFTNLGRDHLDFHADVEDYFAAKASLFTPRAGPARADQRRRRVRPPAARRGDASRWRPSRATGQPADWRAERRRPRARRARPSPC